MVDFLIVGAGLYGAVCAHELTKKGYKCLVIEKRPHIGGNIYTELSHDIYVHRYGPHIFHTSNKYVWDYINQFATFNNFVNSPLAIYKGELYNLPFNMNTFSKLWNIKTPNEARAIIEKEKAISHIQQPANLEEQAINLVGSTVYEKLIEGYTAKQWGRKCKDLPPFIIKRLPVRFTYNNNYFNDRYQGIPIGGYTSIIEKMLEGIEVKINYDYFAHKDELNKTCKFIIFTGPIDQYFNYKYGCLEYRSVRFETETMNFENYQGNAVINYTEYEIPYTRVIEHKFFDYKPDNPVTIVSKEYPSTWNKDLEPYYPINDEKNNNLYNKYLEESYKLSNVIFGGRLGMYKYLDMDKVLEYALAKVEEITKTYK